MGRVVHLSLVQTTAGIGDDFGDAILLLVQHGPEPSTAGVAVESEGLASIGDTEYGR